MMIDELVACGLSACGPQLLSDNQHHSRADRQTDRQSGSRAVTLADILSNMFNNMSMC